MFIYKIKNKINKINKKIKIKRERAGVKLIYDLKNV